MTPPPPRIPPPPQSSQTPAHKPAPPPPPIAPLDPGVPWGPIRIKWHGRYLRPEAASLIFGTGLLITVLAGFGCWRLFQFLSRPAPVLQPAPIVNRFPPPLPRKAPRRSRTKPAPAEEPNDRPDRFPAATPNLPSSKPSAAMPQSAPQTPAALIPPPVIAVFQASSPNVEPGASTILRWAVAGEVTSVTIAPGLGEFPPSGELEVRPERTTRYTLSATGPGGTVSMSFILRVEAS